MSQFESENYYKKQYSNKLFQVFSSECRTYVTKKNRYAIVNNITFI